jgi:hypothetical protein
MKIKALVELLIIGIAESPARDVTLLTGGFNRRLGDAVKLKSPARDDTLFEVR